MLDSDFSPSLDREEPGTGELFTSKKAKLLYGATISSAKTSRCSINQKKESWAEHRQSPRHILQGLTESLRLGKPGLTASPGEAGMLLLPNLQKSALTQKGWEVSETHRDPIPAARSSNHPKIRKWPASILGHLIPGRIRPRAKQGNDFHKDPHFFAVVCTQMVPATLSFQLTLLGSSLISLHFPDLALALHLWQDSPFPSGPHFDLPPPFPRPVLLVEDAAYERSHVWTELGAGL